MARAVGDGVAGGDDLAKVDLDLASSNERVYEEDRSLRPFLLNDLMQQTVLQESIKGTLHVQYNHYKVPI